MRDFLWLAGVAALVCAFLALVVWWQVYRWNECRMVGHSAIYCVLTSGR